MQRRIMFFSIFLILIGIVIITFSAPIFNLLLPFITDYLSSDHKITSPHVIERGILIFGVLFIIAGFLLSKIDKILPPEKLKLFFWNKEINNFFFKETHFKNHTGIFSNKSIFSISLIIGIITILMYLLGFMKKNSLSPLFMEDGFFETGTAVLFFLSSLILFFVFQRLRNSDDDRQRSFSKVYLYMLIIFLLIGMEEISWGQRIIGWSTPETLRGINYQEETNLHNVLNPLFVGGYIFIAITLFLGSLLAWISNFQGKNESYHFLFPHPSLLPITFMIVIASLIKELELVEELAALYVILYCLRLARLLFDFGNIFNKSFYHKLKIIRIVSLVSQKNKNKLL